MLGFVSHAHSDHLARHELAICSAATSARFINCGWGVARFGRSLSGASGDRRYAADALSSWALPGIGDVAGRGWKAFTALYGDFRLGPSATAEPAEVPTAEVLIMESTYGVPRYRMPPREEVIEKLRERILWACQNGLLPVVLAYLLGKAQEVTASCFAP